jgi:predicted ATP-grasp superfamily ATP-dependent carboligase
LPRNSPAKSPSLLIVALSGRALAAAVRCAGYAPLVADFFADADTRDIAAACIKIPGDIRYGFQWETLSPVLDRLASEAPSPLLGVVYGSGFEDRTVLLGRVAAHYPLLGNEAGAVSLVKDPEIFFGRLAKLGIPHPPTRLLPPETSAGWLAKRQGGAGGSHIVTSRAAGGAAQTTLAFGEASPPDQSRHLYFQKRVSGRSVSALFVGNGEAARVLGFSEQWASPRRGARWRYGGAAQPAELSDASRAQMTRVAETVAASLKLKGLGSADFLVQGGSALLLEINPRPGATLDIFDSRTKSVLGIHLDAVLEGTLPSVPLGHADARAAGIVYATEPVTISETVEWPDWTADRPRPGERIDKKRPICTVLARAKTCAEAKRLVQERISSILAACSGRKQFS